MAHADVTQAAIVSQWENIAAIARYNRLTIARAYRKGTRIVIVTRISVYHAYVIGYRGKGIVVSYDAPTQTYNGMARGCAYAAFSWDTVQYAGIPTVGDDARGSYARWNTAYAAMAHIGTRHSTD